MREETKEPIERNQQGIGIPGLKVRPREKIGANHLEAVASGLVAAEHQRGGFKGLLDHW